MPDRIQAVVFDMDGVLIDSEPLWQEVEIEVFRSVGVELTAEACRETQGLRCLEVVEYRYRRQPWSGPSLEEVRDRILKGVSWLIRERGQPLPGAREAVWAVRDRGLRCALASSSPMPLIESVVDALGLTGAFESLHSADSVPLGKPHPGVYLRATDALGVAPHATLAVEDSVNGLIAALAAGTIAVAVPDPAQRGDPRFSIAAHVLETLEGLPGLLDALCQ